MTDVLVLIGVSLKQQALKSYFISYVYNLLTHKPRVKEVQWVRCSPPISRAPGSISTQTHNNVFYFYMIITL